MSKLALKLIKENRRQYEAGDPAYKRLDIGRCGLTEIPKEVFELVWLEELIMSDEWEEHDEWKTTLNESQNIEMENRLSNIPVALSKLFNLKILRVNGSLIDEWEISKIENLPEGLKRLDISRNEISRLENLPKGLTHLYIDDNKISRLENLPEGLTHLDISGSEISRLENLPECLTQLFIAGNQITRLENLPKGLTQLNVFGNQISRLENLPEGLAQLIISANQITRLENLPEGLIQFSVWNNQVSVLENLPQNLRIMDFRGNKIKDITPIKDWVINKGFRIVWNEWPSDKEIAVGDNRLVTPPSKTVKKGDEAILQFFIAQQ